MNPKHASDSHISYEPDERAPLSLTVALGAQYAILSIAAIVLGPAIIVRAAGGADSYLIWAAFAALVVSGLTTILQAVRVGRVGAGHILLMGTSGAFIAVCVSALVQGGPGLMATLIVASSFIQFVLSTRLSLLRRVVTPVVAGTVIMLISVTIMPILFDMLRQVPEGTSQGGGTMSAFATLAVIVVLALRAKGPWRLWAPVIGIVAGCTVSAFYGMYDVSRVAEAGWIGLPSLDWPGLDFSFGTAFWALLPVFVLVTVVGAVETVGDAIAIQAVSWRKKRATDFRVVQGAVAADGVGNLLSGFGGTVPNTTYSSSTAITELTGVAARSVGVWIGIIFVVLAFLPKSLAIVLAVPDPVVGAYGIVLLAMLFVLGVRIAVQDGIDYRKGVIIGVAFWVGVGFQDQAFLPSAVSPLLQDLLGNGMTMGGLAAILMTVFLEITAPSSQRLHTRLGPEAAPQISTFLTRFASDRSWSEKATNRLRAAAEETLLSLSPDHALGIGPEAAEKEWEPNRRLLLVARGDRTSIELEFISSAGEGNLEDRLAFSGVWSEDVPEREISLRLLRHYASSVKHQQYHDTDVVTLRVEANA